MSICNGDKERKLKINGICLSPRGMTAENHSTGPKFELNFCILMTNLCLNLNISMHDRDNELKLNSELLNDERREWRKGVTLYAPFILWRGIKMYLVRFDPLTSLAMYQINYGLMLTHCSVNSDTWCLHCKRIHVLSDSKFYWTSVQNPSDTCSCPGHDIMTFIKIVM